ncbi:MAG TPA: DinB family protein [Mycobacterium sp.]|nr:DinB family protein [Mycobacterium sp.]
MDRCDGCGFEYHEEAAPEAPGEILTGARALAAIIGKPGVDARTRRGPEQWSPLEYACHVRDLLLVQRERVLAARWVDGPSFAPMGRDERVELDGYAEQDRAAVARQLEDAAAMFVNVLGRLEPREWDRTVVYNYPVKKLRTLGWVAVHTLHEVRHHLQDVQRQLT